MYGDIAFVFMLMELVAVFAEPTDKPNIVLLVADDLGYGDLGCFGNGSVNTPNIDNLAREGVKMTQHIAAASVCTPSRSALLTGRYQTRTGMAPTTNLRVNIWPCSSGGLPCEEITFAEVTKKAGYRNALIGKWHLGYQRTTGGNEHHPLHQGFDYFYGLLGTNLDDFGEHEGMKKVIDSARPAWRIELFSVWAVTAVTLLCLYKTRSLSFKTCLILITIWTVPVLYVFVAFNNFVLLCSFLHRNYDVVEQPIRLGGLSQRFVNEGKEFIQNSTAASQPFMLVMSFVHMHTHLKTAKEFKNVSKFGVYGDALEELDWSVGEILKTLDVLGVSDKTLVYFTSDNGPHLELGDKGGSSGILTGGKTHGAPDGGIRIPGMVKWPGVIPVNTVTDEPTTQMDMYNMISSAVGVALPTDRTIDGRNIMPLLTNEETVSPHEFLFHYCGDTVHAARYRPRTGTTTWKLVTHVPNYIPGSKLCGFACRCSEAIVLETPALYDVTVDMGETTPKDTNSSEYKEISEIILKAINRHKESLAPVENQFALLNLAPRLDWQPCCNGIFPFGCHCTDPKYEI